MSHPHHPQNPRQGQYNRYYRPSRVPYDMSYGRPYGRRPGWGFSWFLFPMFFWFIWGGGFWMFPLGIILLFWLLPMIMGAVSDNQAAVADTKEKGIPSYDYADDYVDDYQTAYDDDEYFETVDGQRLRVVDDDGSQTRLTIG